MVSTAAERLKSLHPGCFACPELRGVAWQMPIGGRPGLFDGVGLFAAPIAVCHDVMLFLVKEGKEVSPEFRLSCDRVVCALSHILSLVPTRLRRDVFHGGSAARMDGVLTLVGTVITVMRSIAQGTCAT